MVKILSISQFEHFIHVQEPPKYYLNLIQSNLVDAQIRFHQLINLFFISMGIWSSKLEVIPQGLSHFFHTLDSNNYLGPNKVPRVLWPDQTIQNYFFKTSAYLYNMFHDSKVNQDWKDSILVYDYTLHPKPLTSKCSSKTYLFYIPSTVSQHEFNCLHYILVD